ncbi:MAG TPA: hypothetical protein VN890_06115, partial [Methylocella sp.]|nr:hypothetical protein [Methylocella sp.]
MFDIAKEGFDEVTPTIHGEIAWGIGFARESITEREFSECVPAVRWNFFAGPPIHIEGKGITVPRRLNLYSR